MSSGWIDETNSEIRVFRLFDADRLVEACAAMQAKYPDVVEIFPGPGFDIGGECFSASQPPSSIILLGLNAVDAAL